MATVKLALRKRKNKDGTQPLIIRIRKDRKASIIHLGHHVYSADWDAKAQRIKKSHPNSARLNNYLIKKLAEATDKALELETQKEHVSSKAVRQKIKPSAGDTFLAQAKLYLDTLKTAGKYNRYTADKPRIKHFKEFLKTEDIAFSDVTVTLLERFKAYLKNAHSLSDRSIMNHLVVIRSVFSQAIASNVTSDKYYPFGRGKMKIKFPDSIKIGLTQEEVKKLEEVELDEPYHNHCRNLWLFSFYFAGMRAADVLSVEWSNFQNERFYYAMNKNTKADSLKVPEKVLEIMKQYEQYKNDKDDLIFPELKRLDNFNDKFILQRTIAFAVSSIDKALRLHVGPKAKIAKRLTMHLARHTFGNISGDKIPIQMLQKLYRHSSITTTIGYQANFIYKDADDALNAVIGF